MRLWFSKAPMPSIVPPVVAIPVVMRLELAITMKAGNVANKYFDSWEGPCTIMPFRDFYTWFFGRTS